MPTGAKLDGTALLPPLDGPPKPPFAATGPPPTRIPPVGGGGPIPMPRLAGRFAIRGEECVEEEEKRMRGGVKHARRKRKRRQNRTVSLCEQQR